MGPQPICAPHQKIRNSGLKCTCCTHPEQGLLHAKEQPYCIMKTSWDPTLSKLLRPTLTPLPEARPDTDMGSHLAIAASLQAATACHCICVAQRLGKALGACGLLQTLFSWVTDASWHLQMLWPHPEPLSRSTVMTMASGKASLPQSCSFQGLHLC